MRFHQTPRRGFALAVSLLAIVIIGALIAGAFFASTQEGRVGRNTLVQQRAFSAAEYGLNETVATFDKSLNLTMAAGDVQQITYNSASASGTQPSGARANVRLTKLNNSLYWVVSEGVVGTAGTSSQAVRRVSTTFRIRKPQFPIGGAITSKGNITVKGSAEVTGNNTPPPGWSQCASIGGGDTAAIAVGDSAVVDIQKDLNVTGTRDYYKDPKYDDTSTFKQFGSDLDFAAMAANADITLSGNVDPTPAGTDSTCVKTGGAALTNWGEPWRGQGFDGCKNYFPVIYSTGDIQLNNGRGQGVLLVNGSVRFNGNFEFYGVIIAKNDVTKGNGSAKIYGSIIAGDNVKTDDTSILGNTFIYYSKCANESATSGSSIIVPVNQRAWADMF